MSIVSVFAIALGLGGCSPVKGASRKVLGLDSTAGDADLEGERFVKGIATEGRVDWSDGDAAAFAWSGTRVSARFEGTSAGVELEDALGKNQFYVIIDGAVQPRKLAAKRGRHAYLLATGLAAGAHEITLHRLTEANQGESRFLGFRFGEKGKLLPPPPRSERRIEVIGDSISTGYGNEGADKTCHFSPESENHYLTYESIAARKLGAELVTVAWSGKGVWTNRASAVDTVPMPPLWKRTLPDREESRWDFAGFQAQAVVINLGTNDFAPEVQDVSPFAAAYLAFVREVRAAYPRATIFCTLGPALSDNWPEGRATLTNARRGIEAAVRALRDKGDAAIHFLEYPVQTEADGYGCDWHPSLRTHARMADQLTNELRAKMHW